MGNRSIVVEFMVVMVITILIVFGIGSYATKTVSGYKDRIEFAIGESELGGILSAGVDDEEYESETITVEGIVEMFEESLEDLNLGGN